MSLGKTLTVWNLDSAVAAAASQMTAGSGLISAGTAIDVIVGSGLYLQDDLLGAITRTNTAGSGLTGGGDTSANRRYDIVGVSGITVNADSIQTDATYLSGIYAPNISGVNGVFTGTGVTSITIVSGIITDITMGA